MIAGVSATNDEDASQHGRTYPTPRRWNGGFRWAARLRPVVWLSPTLALSMWIAYELRFDGSLPSDTTGQLWQVIPLSIIIKTLALLAMKFTLSCHAFVSMHDAYRLLRANFVATASLAIADSFLLVDTTVPRGVILIDGCLSTLLIGGILTLRRTLRERAEQLRHAHCHSTLNAPGTQPKRVILVTNADRGGFIIHALRNCTNPHFQVLGILTDNEWLQQKAIAGIRVLGKLQDMETCAMAHGIEALLLSSGDLQGTQVRDILAIGERLGIEVRVIPDMLRLLKGQVNVKPREVAIEDLLGRPQVAIDQSELSDWLKGKRILVTGSCGSIGSELVRQLLKFSPSHLALVDRSENGQFHLGRELQEETANGIVDIILADVCDATRLNSIFRRYQPQVVFHAAAYKHVPMLEHHPTEGVKNIIGATKSIVDLSHGCGVETFVMVSTDKAVNPTNVMGCCKRVAELYVQSMAYRSTCKFVTVRFGNVLGSAGSVIPVFSEQIALGGPVTVTDPEMVRYFMTIPEASRLVLQAAAMGEGGEIFVLDMGNPVRIMDLARDMIRLSGLREGKDIEIAITGLRPGEKLYEELYSSEETQAPTRHPKILKASCIEIPFQKINQAVSRILSLANGSPATSIYTELKSIVPSFNPDRYRLQELHGDDGNLAAQDNAQRAA